MAKLKELWDAGGGKPVRVRGTEFLTDYYFCVLGFSPCGEAVGFYKSGIGGKISKNHSEDDWSLYEEPRPKKKLYAYLRVDNGKIINPIHCLVFADSEMNFTPTSSQDKYKMTRVPEFDCEVDDV